ncbi:hypothetical protein [Hydrogenimonas sp.]
MTTETEKNETTMAPKEAAEKLLAEVQSHGFMRMIDLDPYFGTVEIPLQKEIEVLAETHPEAFAFFKAFMDDLQEEIEIHFEVTEMYEDEEFDQFVEDCRIIKERYSRDFAERLMPELEAFVTKV